MKKVISENNLLPEMVTITPALASAWLADNHFDNRKLDDRNVDKISRDIKADRWIFDGNPIRFDKEGNILDGQHRLWAVVMSGKSVKSLVIKNLENQAKKIIDSGKARSNADFLHFNGYTNTSVLAAVCRLSIGYKENKGNLWKWAQGTSSKRLTPQELICEADNNKKIDDAITATISLRFSKKILSPATVAFCYYLFSEASKNPKVVDKFFEALETGENLPIESPILSLRNTFIIRDIDMKERHGGNKAMAYRIALVIKTWNAWKDNVQIKKFRYDVDKDSYPIPK